MNKIGWCSETWNPVIGCKNNCNYCYAKRINDRFNFIKDFNIPEWREKSFNKKLPKKPQRIFVGSMSEIHYWEPEWIEMVIEKVKQYPQHTFMFLTKYPNEVYLKYDFPENCWLGTTVTKETDMYKNDWNYLYGNNIYFISFEPLLEDLNLNYLNFKNIDWVIIGAETGNRKNKVKPRRSWIENILYYCRRYDIPVYIKYNLSKYYDEYRGYKEFPK